MNKLTTAVATGVAVAGLALPIGWALAPAGADPAPTTTVATPTTEPASSDAPTRQDRLAEKLGVTPDELREARLSVLQEELDTRVADGRITQERADRIMEAARSGRLRELRSELRRERRAERR